MKYLLQIFFSLSVCCWSCKSDSEKTIDKFEKIDQSLKDFNSDTTYRKIYNRISSKKDIYHKLFLVVDSLTTKLEIASNLLDSIIVVIELTDTTGEKVDIGATLLVNTTTGQDMIDETYSVYRYAADNSAHQASKDKIESFFTKYSGLFGTKHFVHLLDKTPSIGVMTILRGVKADCMKAATICISDIESRLLN